VCGKCSDIKEGKQFFLEKKKKTLIYCGQQRVGHFGRDAGSSEQKFLGSYFQKRTALSTHQHL
jgi:hypothetical protein